MKRMRKRKRMMMKMIELDVEARRWLLKVINGTEREGNILSFDDDDKTQTQRLREHTKEHYHQ